MDIVKFDRFFVEEENFDKFSELESDEKFHFRHHPELFLLSLSIGFYFNLRIPLIKRKELTQLSSFLNLEYGKVKYGETIYEAFKLLAEKEKEIDEDGRLKVNIIMEEYANGGFTKLYNEILNPEAPLSNKDKYLNFILLNLELD